MKRLLLLLWVFGIAATTYSQGAPGIPARPASIEGRVLAESEGRALPDAAVTLSGINGAARKTTFTDGLGTFYFFDLPRGRYTLTATHAEYEPRTVSVDFYGETETDVRLVLSPQKSGAGNSAAPSVPAWALQIPDPALHEFSRGLEELAQGKTEKSIASFVSATEAYPRYATAWSAMGAAQMALGKNEAALSAFQRALEIDANLVDANLGLGVLYRAQKRLDEAESLLLRAGAQKPGDGRIHLELAEVYWQRGSWEKAEPSLRITVKTLPQMPRPLLLLINVLALEEKYAESYEHMEKFLQRFPSDAFASKVREKRDKLRAELERTAAINP